MNDTNTRGGASRMRPSIYKKMIEMVNVLIQASSDGAVACEADSLLASIKDEVAVDHIVHSEFHSMRCIIEDQRKRLGGDASDSHPYTYSRRYFAFAESIFRSTDGKVMGHFISLEDDLEATRVVVGLNAFAAIIDANNDLLETRPPERIVQAAILYNDVVHQCSRKAGRIIEDEMMIKDGGQVGFYTSRFRFVDRREALSIAIQAGQVSAQKTDYYLTVDDLEWNVLGFK